VSHPALMIVAVTKTLQLAARHHTAIDNTGVSILIDDDVIALVHQRRDRPQVRLVASGENQSRFLADELRQTAIKLKMQLQRSVQKRDPVTLVP
jgi:hypothetical protein